MSLYGGVGLEGVRHWADLPIVTACWLLGSAERRLKGDEDGPDEVGALTAEDRSILKMLEQKLKDRERVSNPPGSCSAR